MTRKTALTLLPQFRKMQPISVDDAFIGIAMDSLGMSGRRKMRRLQGKCELRKTAQQPRLQKLGGAAFTVAALRPVKTVHISPSIIRRAAEHLGSDHGRARGRQSMHFQRDSARSAQPICVETDLSIQRYHSHCIF